jgi:hypothetical protein
VTFFFASAGASGAYLTVSEIFPVEVRAKAIAVFFAIAQTFGALGPWLYWRLIGDGQDHTALFAGYMLGAGVMILGALVETFLGVDAEGRSLEDIAPPLGAATPSSHLSNATGGPRPPEARSVVDLLARRGRASPGVGRFRLGTSRCGSEGRRKSRRGGVE